MKEEMNYKSNPFIELMNTNKDLSTGIRYSTIYGNDIMSEAIDDIIQSGTDLTYENYISEMKEDFINHVQEWINQNNIPDDHIDYDQMFEPVQDSINNRYESDCTTWEYNQDGYIIQYHSSDNSLTILKSPYFTYSRLASACFPNGCYLLDVSNKEERYPCYCLGADWFEGNKAPYEVLKVSDYIQEQKE